MLADFAAAAPFPVVVLSEPVPGLGRARNRGAAVARGELVAFTDDDCRLPAGHLAGVAAAFADLDVDWLGGRILADDGDQTRVALLEDPTFRYFPPGGVVWVGAVQGANLAVRRPVLEAVGGFDERLGAGTEFRCEDVDLCARLAAAGRRGARCPDLVVWHGHGRDASAAGALEAANDVARGAFVAGRIAAGGPDARGCVRAWAGNATRRWGWRPRNAARALGATWRELQGARRWWSAAARTRGPGPSVGRGPRRGARRVTATAGSRPPDGGRRVLAIGLDACSWPFVERLGASGRLPVLTRLAATTAAAEVRGPSAYRAELSWTAFLSGRRPEETGYWGTIGYDPATYATWEAGALAIEPFYARLGVPVVAVDVPHAVPWPGLPGAQVVAWGAHSPQHRPACEPPGLPGELIERVGPHPAFDVDSEPGWHSGRYQEELCAALGGGARRRAELVAALLTQVPDWRLAVTVFSEPHSAGHHLWHGVDASHPAARFPGATAAGRRLARVYGEVDAAIGRLLEAAGPDTVVVIFSVHDTVANANDLPALYLVPELLHRDAHGWPHLVRAASAPTWPLPTPWCPHRPRRSVTSSSAPIEPIGGAGPRRRTPSTGCARRSAGTAGVEPRRPGATWRAATPPRPLPLRRTGGPSTTSARPGTSGSGPTRRSLPCRRSPIPICA